MGRRPHRASCCLDTRRHAVLLWTFIALLGAFLGPSAPADAHHRRKGASTAGLVIPNLTHGQLRVIAKYRNDILDLSYRQSRPDTDTRTLQNFVNLQFTYCLWGLVPGSLANEDNPFNECSHAYLAATKALLQRLGLTSDNPSAAHELTMRIHAEMLRDDSALEVCANGIDPLNTADLIMPEWSGYAFNPIVLLYSLIAFLVTAGLFAVHFARRPKRSAAV
jgi:hypothetical protein